MKVINFLWHQYPGRLLFAVFFFPAAYYGMFRYGANTLGWLLAGYGFITLSLVFFVSWAIDAEKISHK